MTPSKQVLTQIQEMEKKNHLEVVDAFSVANMNLNLCKTYLSKLISSHLTSVELKRDIKEFLESIK